jgi:hypothetical protein
VRSIPGLGDLGDNDEMMREVQSVIEAVGHFRVETAVGLVVAKRR